ncbi:hypothetical protein BKA62DRAFT_265331 [Auriculariales sp. MPI-PUGE-AT-0066]|nr:hypothetical protein BKA62DRAFT_265331 [Auriculariales sp. MPI-PUGE-AT-0066]
MVCVRRHFWQSSAHGVLGKRLHRFSCCPPRRSQRAASPRLDVRRLHSQDQQHRRPVFSCWHKALFESNLEFTQELVHKHVEESRPNQERYRLLTLSPLINSLCQHLRPGHIPDIDDDWGPIRTTPIVDYLARPWFALGHPKQWKRLPGDVPARLRAHHVHYPAREDAPPQNAQQLPTEFVEQQLVDPYDSDGDSILEADMEVDNQQPELNAWQDCQLTSQFNFNEAIKESCGPAAVRFRELVRNRLGDHRKLLEVGNIVEVAHETKHARTRYEELKKAAKRVRPMNPSSGFCISTTMIRVTYASMASA